METLRLLISGTSEYLNRYGWVTLLYTLGFEALSVALETFCRRRWTRGNPTHKETEQANALASTCGFKAVPFVHALIVAPSSVYGLLTEASFKDATFAALQLDRDKVGLLAASQTYGRSGIAEMIVPITMAYFVRDAMYYKKWETDTPYYVEMMMIHHAMSLALWPAALAKGIGHWYLLHFLMYELSSPLLYIRWFLGLFRGQKGLLLDLINLAFSISFIAVRVCTIPSLYVGVMETFQYHPKDKILQVLTYSAFVPMILNVTWSSMIVGMVVQRLVQLFKSKQE